MRSLVCFPTTTGERGRLASVFASLLSDYHSERTRLASAFASSLASFKVSPTVYCRHCSLLFSLLYTRVLVS